jgi:hypothetical protein
LFKSFPLAPLKRIAMFAVPESLLGLGAIGVVASTLLRVV